MLSRRLSLIVACVLLVALAAFGLLTDRLFERSQRAQLDSFLKRELARVQEMVASTELGSNFVREDGPDLTLQFVDGVGTVQLPPEGGEALPLHGTPSLVGSPARLVASVPWRLPSGREVGTIRAALNVESYVAARRDLVRSLVLSGGVIVLVAGLAALGLVQRALRPLGRLAARAAEIDPARPELDEPLVARAAGDDEVAQLARALERAVAAIRARQQSERDALAEVAHELASPLTVVAGHLRALEGAHRKDPDLRAARRAADELLHTSQDLLTLARGELEREVDLQVLDLAALARDVAEETAEVRVRTDAPVEVLGDPGRLRQLTRNLLRNAVQASTPEGEVEVSVEVGDGMARLEVADRGHGLHDGDGERIFERHASGRPGGNGLGLAVAREIARRHDGELTATPREGGGARFTLLLPTLASRWEDPPRPDVHESRP